MPRHTPAWCSVSTPVMWSSTTITSSTCPCHCCANIPTVAEPQPARMRCSSTPLTTGARPACATTVLPPSMASSTASQLHSASSVSQVIRPALRVPPVSWFTPPIASICEPYSAMVTCPTGSPSARMVAHSGPR